MFKAFLAHLPAVRDRLQICYIKVKCWKKMHFTHIQHKVCHLQKGHRAERFLNTCSETVFQVKQAVIMCCRVNPISH